LLLHNLSFVRVDGNALMLSRFHRNATIHQCSFKYLGGSAIALWGWTDELSDGGVHGVDGTAGICPWNTTISSSLFREIGIWEKQSSAIFQAKAAATTIRHNLIFNLGRAGINLNDGFGGGDVIEENVLFNTCRESSDHGPINSWDRQPFSTTVRTGAPSTQMAWRDVRRNLVIANYGGVKEVDTDDGSLFWRIHHNVMAFGWGQKFKCGAIESFHNLKLFIDLGSKFDVGCLLGGPTMAEDGLLYPNLWHHDLLIHFCHQCSDNFEYRQCWGATHGHDWDRERVYNNTIYVASAAVQATINGMTGRYHAGNCHHGKQGGYTLEQFQALGEEPGTRRLAGYPAAKQWMSWALKLLGTFDEHAS